MISLLLFAEQTTENNVQVSWIDFWSFIVSCISIIVTTFLTVFIIVQTYNNTKKNIELSEKIAKSEETFNKLQLKLQQREDKKQAYLTICKCIQYSCTLNEMLPTFFNMKSKEISDCNCELRKIYKIDIVQIIGELKLAQLFVSCENKELVKEFTEHFTKLLNELSIFDRNKHQLQFDIQALQNIQQVSLLIVGKSKRIISKLDKELTL